MEPGVADRAALLRILSSPWLAQCCYALAKLGIPDLMADGPRPVSELARESGTHPRSLHRVLRALAAEGVLTAAGGDAFGLGPTGYLLRAGVPRSHRDLAVMLGEEVFRSFADITYTLQTGQPAFDKVYGMPFYDYLGTSPRAAATFGAAMAGAAVPAALASCDLTGVKLVVDVGGGDGALLARVLRAQPQARGVLFDLPQAMSAARERLTRAGVADRVDLVAGSFFETVPAGGEAYVLCRVLHNWPDEQTLALLRQIRAAMDPRGRLLVFEDLLGSSQDGASQDGASQDGASQDGASQDAEGTDAAGQDAADGPAPVASGGNVSPAGSASPDRGGAMDLLLMVMLSGWDRTEAEYRDLLAEAGFAVRAVRPPPLRARQPESVIEAVPS